MLTISILSATIMKAYQFAFSNSGKTAVNPCIVNACKAVSWKPINNQAKQTAQVGVKGLTNEKNSNEISVKWKEYQGARNWEGMLDPLDDHLREEILRYGNFVEAAYRSFDWDLSSPSYASCRYPEASLFNYSGVPGTGYRPISHLTASSSIRLPGWVEELSANQNSSKLWINSSWIGYIAVCEDEEEISRLGRRDVVIAYRGTATWLEWLENMRSTLCSIPECGEGEGPMVGCGFLSLYTSKGPMGHSLRDMVREEMKKIIETYPHEPLSITVTGHTLGAALGAITACDLKTAFPCGPDMTVISFGGPRVGNNSFGQLLEENLGIKVLRIVNSDDVVTMVPGIVVDGTAVPNWVHKRMEETQWMYGEIGRELRLCSRHTLPINKINIGASQDLKTYLQLVHARS